MALITWVLVLGVKESAIVNNIMVGLKIVMAALLFSVARAAGLPEAWQLLPPVALLLALSAAAWRLTNQSAERA